MMDKNPNAIATRNKLHVTRNHFVKQPSFIVAAVSAIIVLGVLSASDDTSRWALLALGGTVAAVLGIAAAYRSPTWLVLALMVEETLPYLNILPFDPEKRWFLRYPLLLPLCIPSLWFVWKSRLLTERYLRLLFVFFLWGAVTVSYSLNPPISMGRLLPDFLVFVTLLFAIENVSDADGVQKLLGNFLIGCTILQFFTVIAWIFFPPNLTHMIDDQGLSRFTGIGTDANAVGSLMLATVGAGIAHWHATRGRARVILAITIISSIVFAILADSRSETAAALIGCCCYSIWRYRLKGFVICAMMVFAGIAIYNWLGPSVSIYLDRDVTTLTGRTEAWRFELVKLKQRPLLGYGYEVEGEIFQDQYFTNWQDFWDQGPNTALHDSYLTVAIGMGIPALALWLSAFIAPWIFIFRARDDPWNLRPLAFLVILPALLLGIDESGLSEPRAVRGLLVFTTWLLTLRYQRCIARSADEVTCLAENGWRRALQKAAVLMFVTSTASAMLNFERNAPAFAASHQLHYDATEHTVSLSESDDSVQIEARSERILENLASDNANATNNMI